MFTDSQGRKFDAVIVLPTVVQLKAMGVDLGLDLPKVVEAIQADAELLGNVLYLVHQESAETNGVSDSQFGRLLNGDTLPKAIDSLIDAIINFSQPATRAALRKLVEKGRDVNRLTAERMELAVDRLSAEQILSICSATAGDSQESSALTSEKTASSDDSLSAS